MAGVIRSWLAPTRPDQPPRVLDQRERRLLGFEVVLLVFVAFGTSAIRSVLSLLEILLRPEPMSDQAVAMNPPQAEYPVIDFLRQLVDDGYLIALGLLALVLLARAGATTIGIGPSAIGLDRRRPFRDLGAGALLAIGIGVAGLGLYLASHALGFSVTVQPAPLDGSWWRIVVLVSEAVGNAWAEEVVVVGYLLTRLRQFGLAENASLLISALLRGSYHLYQGFGGFVGNLIMGLIFGRLWQKTNRLWPLVVTHTLLDVGAFVGYALVKPYADWLP